MKIGILGASGFIGNRAVEMLHAKGMEVCPIARTSASLSQLPSYLDGRVANALDRSALQVAFKGCDVIIHSVLGNPGLIRGAIAPAYHAAEKAGVKRLIYLSSMCVHSQCPPPGTTEETPFDSNQPFPYNSAKIDAELKLLQLRSRGSVEVVIFRPGIVFGPRSRWVNDLADQLERGTAYLVDGGKGICNSVYVDNLVYAMQLATNAEKADGQAFFVGDAELVTWSDFYRNFAEALGVNPDRIASVAVPNFAAPSLKQHVMSSIRDSELMQKATLLVSDRLKQRIKEVIPKRNKLRSPESNKSRLPPSIEVTREMALLQQSQYKLPLQKAKEILDYEPIVSFQEGCKWSIEWLIDDEI